MCAVKKVLLSEKVIYQSGNTECFSNFSCKFLKPGFFLKKPVLLKTKHYGEEWATQKDVHED
jgi:hypothetical protein